MSEPIRINFNLTLKTRRITEKVAEAFAPIGLLVARTAKNYAPVSPTQAQRNATLVRKRRSAVRQVPGGLEKSIQSEVRIEGACVFVPSNSAAGQYARYIHDEKGKRWFRRGAGTVAKGDQADEKFIARAIQDNEKNIAALFAAKMKEAMQI